MSRILSIGDIHGCLDKLKALMDVIDWNPDEDLLIFIGDYVDRGQDSSGVLDFLIDLANQSPNVICLIGNHEKMFLDYLAGKNTQTFLLNGGYYTIESYGGTDADIPQAHVDFLKSLRTYYETDEYIFVHAGLRDNVPLDQQSMKDMLWIREDFITSSFDHGKVVIFGHTPLPKPMVSSSKIGIDTGAVYGGELTCVELPDVIFNAV